MRNREEEAECGAPNSKQTRYTMRLPLFLNAPRGRGNDKRRRQFRPTLIRLEDRMVLSPTVFTVTSVGDSPGDPYTATSGDLRYCVGLANANTSNPAGSLIQFDPTVFSTPQTITLGSGLVLSNTADQTTITGPSAALTVSGGGPSSNFSVFTVSYSTVNISGLTITNGYTSSNGGGGVYNLGNLALTNVTVAGNSAFYYGGGGVYNFGTAVLTNVTLSGNSTPDGYGGGIYNGFRATLTNVTLSGNSAPNLGGGGIYNDYTATLTNSTIFANTAAAGGGVFNTNEGTATGTVTLTNDTVSGNSASSFGGGIGNYGTVVLNNTIVANSPSGGDIVGGDVGGSNNLIDDATTSGGLTNGVNGNIVGVNPLLAPNLGSYGGPTETMPPLPGSPVIGAGSTALIPTGITTDQRGEPRTVNGKVDIGSVESQGYTLTSIGGTPQSAAAGTAFANQLEAKLTENGLNDSIPGVTVTFMGPSSGAGIATSLTATTDANGVASVTATANGTAGAYTVTATASGVAGGASFSLTNVNPVVVNNPTDTPVTGETDLRQAIADAESLSGNQSITFAPTVFSTAKTITLTSGQLILTKNTGTLTIQGPGANLLSVSGNNASRVFYLHGASAYLSGLTITGGRAYSSVALVGGTSRRSPCGRAAKSGIEPVASGAASLASTLSSAWSPVSPWSSSLAPTGRAFRSSRAG